MDDVVGYVMVLGLIVIPAYVGITTLMSVCAAVYENQALIVALPFF